MIIAVTAPKKGLGQTTTSINLAVSCRYTMDESVLLIDINKYCRNIEYFLSDAEITKGIDEFIGFYKAGMLSEEVFTTCVQHVGHGMDMMAPNNSLELDGGIAGALAEYSSKAYSATIIDTIGGNNLSTGLFFGYSDVIIVVLDQSKNTVEMAAQSVIYKEFGKKIVFVINRHMNAFENKKIQYTIRKAEEDLKKAGFNSPVFSLDYDVDLINECNDLSILNFMLNGNTGSSSYIKQMEKLMLHIHGTSYPEGKRNIGKIASGIRNKLAGLIIGG